ncbi:polysaccharide deacetylase family protein [Streptomyces sp. TRM70308]|uniref:polysaccharide deacetylase family protein n=1 Tax=Streptomyces sp. TRM70308 TaxID=3131932 RepID=UPI003D01CB17
MKYDHRNGAWARRRLLQGAVCLGALGGYRLLTGAAPGRPEAPGTGGAPAPPPAPSSYRLRPLAGTARPPDGPAVVRARAHRTLRWPGRYIALTFDDGPHPEQTPAVLEVLRRHACRATFFVIGENADWNRDLVRAIADAGHVVANHSWTHPQLDLIPPGRVRSELGRTSELIAHTLGAPPRFARAPYGAWDAASLRVCAELGMEPVGWSVDSLDWTEPGESTIRAQVLTLAHPGAIVLAHDGGGDRWATVRALAHYLPRLLDRGYTPVPVAEPL